MDAAILLAYPVVYLISRLRKKLRDRHGTDEQP